MSRITKTTIVTVVAYTILGYVLTKIIMIPLKGFVKNYTEQEELMESHIGDTIIMRKDTMTVIDFSVTDDTYTLDNGLTVNRKICEKK